ncbi:Ku DNA-binding complex, Ku70 subunit [Peniophora sp. CONT]|nr:Ku DNA-binding complex, Ku70 subunit [Peniophora sp. CONT]
MPPSDEWNTADDDEDEELFDQSMYETRRDVILFAIDCSASMHKLYDDARYEDDEKVQTSNVLMALEAAMQIQKKKVLVGPNDSVGVLFYNTTASNEKGSGTQLKTGTYVYQPISAISAEHIMDLSAFISEIRENPTKLAETYPPTDHPIALGDVFTSCNWVIRDGAPKSATKRVFLLTDNDNPHAGKGRERLILTARTTLVDLVQSGITVEPFFIEGEKGFDKTVFWTEVLLPTRVDEADEEDEGDGVLPPSLSITRINDLLEQMRIYEVPKRAHFSVNFQLGEGFVIGVKGYGLVTEQKKGTYKYFADMGDRMEVIDTRTAYVDEEKEGEVNKPTVLFGMTLGATADDKDAMAHGFGARKVPPTKRVFYTAEEVRSFRTLGLSPGLKLLGFKDRSELAFEDNVKHSLFVYPDETNYAGSKRTFSAMLKSLISKDKIATVLGLVRSNATPTIYALLPQQEIYEEGEYLEPAGMHMIPYPYADDIRAAPITEAARASKDLKAKMEPVIRKLKVRENIYNPDSYPNPSLAFHNAQLEAAAFREEYDPEEFEDLTVPSYAGMIKKAGELIKDFKEALAEDDSANVTIAAVEPRGTKRRADVAVGAAEVRAMYEDGTLKKLTVAHMKDFLKSKSLAVSGKKDDLIERITDWFEKNPE